MLSSFFDFRFGEGEIVTAIGAVVVVKFCCCGRGDGVDVIVRGGVSKLDTKTGSGSIPSKHESVETILGASRGISSFDFRTTAFFVTRFFLFFTRSFLATLISQATSVVFSILSICSSSVTLRCNFGFFVFEDVLPILGIF